MCQALNTNRNFICINSLNYNGNLRDTDFDYSHFTNKDTEAQQFKQPATVT